MNSYLVNSLFPIIDSPVPPAAPTIVVHHAPSSRYAQPEILYHFPSIPEPPSPPAKYEPLHSAQRFGPVPKHIQCPKLQAPRGSKYSEEIFAWVPYAAHYSIRGLPRRVLRPSPAHRLRSALGLENKPSLVILMGFSHNNLSFIPIADAQRRPDIKYRMSDGETMSEDELEIRGFWHSKLISLQAAQADESIRLRCIH